MFRVKQSKTKNPPPSSPPPAMFTEGGTTYCCFEVTAVAKFCPKTLIFNQSMAGLASIVKKIPYHMIHFDGA